MYAKPIKLLELNRGWTDREKERERQIETEVGGSWDVAHLDTDRCTVWVMGSSAAGHTYMAWAAHRAPRHGPLRAESFSRGTRTLMVAGTRASFPGHLAVAQPPPTDS